MTRCNPALTSGLVTELRSAAECVRAYGGVGVGLGLVGTTPLALHLTAARLESEMRAWVHVDEVIAASFGAAADDPALASRLVEFPGLRIVPTVVAPHALDTGVRAVELGVIAGRLATVAEELGCALDTRSSAHYVDLITKEADSIRAYVAKIA